jgi:hypothetical protein
MTETPQELIARLRAAQHYTYIGRNGKPVLARDLEDRAEAAEAREAVLRDALCKVVAAGNLRGHYHALPNDRVRIGGKRSAKGKARDVWLKAFRRAEKAARAALQQAAGE